MEAAAQPVDADGPTGEEALLTRNRSFKSKLLVRSQAIRESHSPPRTATPSPRPGQTTGEQVLDDKQVLQTVEIQITPGDTATSEETRDQQCELLSNSPRVACVCGKECRGRRRFGCPAKQDSGLGCSQECPDCLDSPEILVSPADPPRLPDPCRCPDKKDAQRPPLTKNDSEEKRELTPEQLVRFIRETLNKCRRDRAALLDIEQQLTAFVDDVGRCSLRFPSDTSYGRMLVHRCAELFQLRHTLDHNNKNTVVVSKTGTAGGRIPCTGFRQWCTSIFSSSPHRSEEHTQAKSILKRSAHSLDEPLQQSDRGAMRSKSFEQREQEYQRVRRRIFSHEEERDNEQRWPWSSAPVKLLTADSARNARLLKVQSLEGAGGGASGDLGSDEGSSAGRGPVSKSHSFGGYGRDEQPRILSRQGDLASSSWRLSPSSSGYKTLSLRSTDSVTPSPTGGVSPEPSAASAPGEGQLVWAVSDVASIPPGALIIHPQTGRPLTNPDGSVYHYDPARPPVVPPLSTIANLDQSQADQNGDKRRGRLEKQNSFIDPDCECQSEDYPSESCCSCCEAKSRADWTHRCRHTKTRHKNDSHTQSKQPEITNKPCSPQRTRYEPTNNDSVLTDHSTHSSQSAEPPGRNQTVDQQPNVQFDSSVEPRRSDEDSYQYSTDYGPGAPGDSMQYCLPYYQHVPQTYRINEEMALQQHTVTSPGYAEPPHLAAVKPPPIGYDPALRAQMALGGVVFGPGVVSQNGHPFTNHCRTDVVLQQQSGLLEPKPELSEGSCVTQALQEPLMGAFQGYSGMLSACAGACGVDPLHCLTQHQRTGGVSFGQQLEQPPLPTAYPMPGVMLPQPNLHPYQLATPNQWPWQPMLAPPQKPPTPPMFLPPLQQIPHELYQVHNPVYPVVGYPNLYQQFVPGMQHLLPGYPLCQPLYGAAGEQHGRRNSIVRVEHNQAFRTRPESGRRSLDQSARATPNTPSTIVADDKIVGQMYAGQFDHKADAAKDSSGRQQLSKQSSVDSNPDRRRFRAPKPPVSRQDSAGSELAAKIQQIKEQMSGLNVNSGNGNSSNARQPPANYNQQPPPRNAVAAPSHDSGQLSSAARAIVNSLRGVAGASRHDTSRQDATRHDAMRHDTRRRPDCPANFQRAPQAQYRNNFNQRQDLRRPADRNEEENVANDRIPGPIVNQPERQSGQNMPAGARREAEQRRRERGQDARTDEQMAVNPRRNVNPVVQYQYGRPFMIRQVSAGSWCRRSPGPANFGNGPRRGAPDRRR